ncbi:MAG TPA: mandelate racemase/muconate lactonizing enzyme family protein, partial [Chloroflexota bacterium]|nr:mandelate racemase/muconate lactonizing enzyme family protein [Chloroflexota bacterium]
MRIREVQAFYLSAKLDRPFAWSLRWTDQRSAVLVKITTDDGIVGWGEAGSSGGPAIATVIASQYRPLLIGRDPFDVEVIWEELYASTRDAGQRGTVVDAISVVDVALWDIIGKAVGKPIHKLLGGCARDRVTAYATGLYYYDDDPKASGERVAEAIGYR